MEKEIRTLQIDWRVFTKADIRRIAEVFHNEYKSAQKSKHHSSISFRLHCEGGISYESDSPSILDDGGPIDIKKTQTVQITFHNYHMERSLDISLREGNYHGGELSVRGANKNWVHGNFTRLQEILDAVKPQDNLLLKHKNLIFHIIAFGVGSLLTLIYDLLVLQHLPLPETIEIKSDIGIFLVLFLTTNRWLLFLLLILLVWLEGVVTFAYPIHKWLIELWPKIEFDFGPEHLNKTKIRRQRVWIVASLVIIPIIINIITAFTL